MAFLGKRVSVRKDRPEHIEKHGIKMNVEEIARFADRITLGQEGVHVFHGIDGTRTIVIRGTEEQNGKNYGVFRTMWFGDAGAHPEERTGLTIINHYEPECVHMRRPYASVPCPLCN